MKKECPVCYGRGYIETTLRDLGGRQPHGLGVDAIVPCPLPACKRGVITEESREYAYKNIY